MVSGTGTNAFICARFAVPEKQFFQSSFKSFSDLIALINVSRWELSIIFLENSKVHINITTKKTLTQLNSKK
jgi:hypothetical protein